MKPKTLNELRNTPFVQSGACAAEVEKALACFARHDMRGYGRELWGIRNAGFRAVQTANEAARNELLAQATPADRAKAERYQELTGRARKHFGGRHSAALTRAGARFGASLPEPGAKIVWGL